MLMSLKQRINRLFARWCAQTAPLAPTQVVEIEVLSVCADCGEILTPEAKGASLCWECSQPIDTVLDAELSRLRRVCAWHPGGPLVMDEGTPGQATTHGICGACEAALDTEVQSLVQTAEEATPWHLRARPFDGGELAGALFRLAARPSECPYTGTAADTYDRQYEQTLRDLAARACVLRDNRRAAAFREALRVALATTDEYVYATV